MAEHEMAPVKRLRIEQREASPRKRQSPSPSPRAAPACSPKAAAAAATTAAGPATTQPSAMASSSPPAYPQRGQPALTPQQTLPTIPESHEEAVSELAAAADSRHPLGPSCPWPPAMPLAARDPAERQLRSQLGSRCHQAAPSSGEGQGCRRREDEGTAAAAAEADVAAGRSPRRRRVQGGGTGAVQAAQECPQEYCLAVPMPCAIPAAVLSLPTVQAAHRQQQLHAAWAVVPLSPPVGSPPPQQHGLPHPQPQHHLHHHQRPLLNGAAGGSLGTHWHAARLQEESQAQERLLQQQHPRKHSPSSAAAGGRGMRQPLLCCCAHAPLCVHAALGACYCFESIPDSLRQLADAAPMATDDHFPAALLIDEAPRQLSSAFELALAAAAVGGSSPLSPAAAQQPQPAPPQVAFTAPATEAFCATAAEAFGAAVAAFARSASGGSSSSSDGSDSSSDSMEE